MRLWSGRLTRKFGSLPSALTPDGPRLAKQRRQWPISKLTRKRRGHIYRIDEHRISQVAEALSSCSTIEATRGQQTWVRAHTSARLFPSSWRGRSRGVTGSSLLAPPGLLGQCLSRLLVGDRDDSQSARDFRGDDRTMFGRPCSNRRLQHQGQCQHARRAHLPPPWPEILRRHRDQRRAWGTLVLF